MALIGAVIGAAGADAHVGVWEVKPFPAACFIARAFKSLPAGIFASLTVVMPRFGPFRHFHDFPRRIRSDRKRSRYPFASRRKKPAVWLLGEHQRGLTHDGGGKILQRLKIHLLHRTIGLTFAERDREPVKGLKKYGVVERHVA